MKIDKARALVTGGSSGIGFETAKLLAARGARVAICGRDKAKLEKAAKKIGAVAIHADVSVESEAVRLVADVVRELGDYNVLVNNAGFGSFTPPLKLVGADIAQAIVAMLEMEDRAFVTEMSVWATNPTS